MPVHRISVMPVNKDINEQGSIRTRKKSKEYEKLCSTQGAVRSGASQPFATPSCQETCSTRDKVTSGNHGPDHTTGIIPVNHTPVAKQQVKRRYRRQRKSSGCIVDCVDQSKCAHSRNDLSSGDEQYQGAARSWSREKARRRRRPRGPQDHKNSQRTFLKMEALDSKSANQARQSECGTGMGSQEEGPVTKTHEEQGLGDTDMAVLKAHQYIEVSKLNGPLQESCTDDEPEVCRICHSEGDEECPLITPCRCTGSLRFVHHACLYQWIKSSDTRCCELCKYDFIMETHLKPLCKKFFWIKDLCCPIIPPWKKKSSLKEDSLEAQFCNDTEVHDDIQVPWGNLQMSTSERRRIFCSVILHLAAVACVACSLYTFILMNHTAEGLQQGKEHNGPLEWLFWTKLGIVALSVAAGLIFMYIQCKVYHKLWRRLKAFNSVILVHNCPDSVCNGAEKAPPVCGFPSHTNAPCPVPAGGSAEVAPV